VQLELLSSRGYVGLTFRECERRRESGTLPKRSAVVTFDDGYASVLRAKPVLDAVGFPATVFVVTQFIESGEPLSWPGVDHMATVNASEMQPFRWSQLEELATSGWEVGSHTVTHPRLPELDDTDVLHELVDSRQAIVDHLGACDSLAYPYGAADTRVAAAARRAGYTGACTLSVSHRVDERYLRARVGIYGHDHGLRLRAKVSPTVRRLRRTRLAGAAQWTRELIEGTGRRNGVRVGRRCATDPSVRPKDASPDQAGPRKNGK
jgi:peptidoglycan/xylan/chitin deacetylase (PgdA/CDA1 family)